MPELPDLLYIVSRLRERLLGCHVTTERVREPVVLRFAVRGNLSLLLGRPLDDVFRKSHFVVFRFEGLDLAVNPMLAGRFRLSTPGDADEGALGFALGFGNVELRYLDDKKMGKAYLIATEDWQAVPGMQTGGIDILSPEFSRERFVSVLKHRRDQVRVFLLDKKALDSLGNAYADEVLFEAGIHPEDLLPLALAPGRPAPARRHRRRDERGCRRGRAPGRADRREGAGLPEGAPQGDLPALRLEAPHRRGQGHGLLVLPALPAGNPARPRRLDAHRSLTHNARLAEGPRSGGSRRESE